MTNRTEYLNDLDCICASDEFLALTAALMLKERPARRALPTARHAVRAAAVIAAAGAGTAVFLLCTQPSLLNSEGGTPEISIASSDALGIAPDLGENLQPPATPNNAGSSKDLVYLHTLVEIDSRLIELVGAEAYKGWSTGFDTFVPAPDGYAESSADTPGRAPDETGQAAKPAMPGGGAPAYSGEGTDPGFAPSSGDASGSVSHRVGFFNADGTVDAPALMDQGLPGFLRRFGISKEVFVAALPLEKTSGEGAHARYRCAYTDEQVDALFSGDSNAVLKAFAGTHAAYKNGNLYSIYWFEERTGEQYLAAGFSFDELTALFSGWGILPADSAGAGSNAYKTANIVKQYTLLKEVYFPSYSEHPSLPR